MFSERLKADLALVFVTLIWGVTFVVVKEVLADVSPLVFVLLRMALATALLLALFGRRLEWRSPGVLRAGMIVGFFLCAGYIFQTMGLQSTTPAKSAFITSLSVVLVPLLAVVLFRKRLRWPVAAGVIAATAGLYFLTMPAGSFVFGRGDLLTLGCAVSFAAHILSVGHFAPRYSIVTLAVGQIGAAMFFCLLAVPLAHAGGVETAVVRWTPRLVVALVLTGALATALAFLIQTWAQRFTTSSHTALLFSLEPVFAVLTSYLVIGERLSARGWLGGGLILAGVLVTELWGSVEPDLPGALGPANPAGTDRV